MYRWKYHSVRSRSVGVGSATMRVTRGFMYWVIRLIVPPLPAASRPSKITTILAPEADTQSSILRAPPEGGGAPSRTPSWEACWSDPRCRSVRRAWTRAWTRRFVRCWSPSRTSGAGIIPRRRGQLVLRWSDVGPPDVRARRELRVRADGVRRVGRARKRRTLDDRGHRRFVQLPESVLLARSTRRPWSEPGSGIEREVALGPRSRDAGLGEWAGRVRPGILGQRAPVPRGAGLDLLGSRDQPPHLRGPVGVLESPPSTPLPPRTRTGSS